MPSAFSGRPWACTPSSAITTGGTICTPSAPRQGPVNGRRVLEAVGIPVYENDVVRLNKDGRPFWLAGLGDQMAFITSRRKRAWRRFEGVDDLDGTLAKITDDAPVVLLAHEPDIFPARARARVTDALRSHARRPGARLRLFADGALALWQSVCLRPHRRKASAI